MSDDHPALANTISYADWIAERLRSGWRERIVYLMACLQISLEDRDAEALRYGIKAVVASMKGREHEV